MSLPPILDRIDAALEKMALRGEQVRAIYLTAEDHVLFNKAMNRLERRRGCSFLAYGDHQIRRGQTSSIYSTFGVATNVPKRLSPRVAKDPDISIEHCGPETRSAA